MPAALLNCFGAFRVEIPGTGSVSLHGRKTAALLVYLALEPVAHSRSSLAGLVWPELGEEAARSNLRVALARLRRAFGPELLYNDRRSVKVHSDSLEADALEFSDLVVQTQQHSHASRAACPECLSKLARAAQLYRGEFLEDLALEGCPPFEEWLRVRREQFRLDALALLSDLSQHAQNKHDYAAAEGYTRQLLRLEPLHEEAQRGLMRLLAWQGRRGAALEEFQTYRTLVRQELGLEPEAATLELYRQLEADKIHAPKPDKPSGFRHNLPAELTPLVGREADLEALQAHLSRHRLITLLGMAGIGKTRLALALAQTQVGHLADGVFLVRLAAAQQPGELLNALAQAVGHRLEESPSAEEHFFEYLEDKQMLLLLDNFEHLLEARGLVLELLRRAPKVRLVVTSRQKLGLSDEAVYALAGLDYQPTPGLSSAAQLFVQTGQRTRLGRPVAESELPEVGRITRLVKGHPLGLILAASWLELLSCRQIAEGLEQGLQLLEADALDLPPAHRSIRVALEQSWQQLEPSDAQSLARLAVFRGGFDGAAASAVTMVDLRGLGRLVGRSFVQHTGERYELHELIARFALEKLRASGELEALRQAHAAHYLGALSQWEQVFKAGQNEVAAHFEADFENLRTAWQWALGQKNLPLLGASVGGLFLFGRGLSWHPLLIESLEPLARWLAQVNAETPGEEATQVFELNVLLALGASYRSSLGYHAPQLAALMDRAYAVSRHLPDSPHLFAVLFGAFSYNMFRFERAEEVLDEWRRRIEAAPDHPLTPLAAQVGQVLEATLRLVQGHYTRAQHLLEAVFARDQPMHDPTLIAIFGVNPLVTGLGLLANAYIFSGLPERAVEIAQQAQARAGHHPESLAQVTGMLAYVYYLRGDPEYVQETARLAQLTRTHRLEFFRFSSELAEAFITQDAGARFEVVIEQALTSGWNLDIYGGALGMQLGEALPADSALNLLRRLYGSLESAPLRCVHADLLRLEGVAQLEKGLLEAAETKFTEAITLAQRQGAKLLELRALTSLSGLLHQQGRTAEAQIMLSAAYASFSEGLETRDLKAAARVLQTLEAEAGHDAPEATPIESA